MVRALQARQRLVKRLALAAALVLLAGCGRVGDLRPPPGQALPVKPKMAAVTPSASDLLTVPPYARPERVDEIQSRNRERSVDRFDLPPPDGSAAPVAETDQAAEARTDNLGPATPR